MAPRTLFVSTFAPTLGDGRALRTYTTVRALAALGPVDLAYVPHGGGDPAPEYQAIPGIEFHVIRPSRGARRALAFALKRAQGAPPQCARGASPEVVEVTRRLAARAGRVVAGDMNAMTALMPFARSRPVVYNAHNVESSYRHDPDIGRVTWLPISLLERRILRRAQESWMVSHRDIEHARRLAPSARLRYVPNVVDVAAIVPRAPAAASAAAAGPTVLMVGNFGYEPNALGAKLLVDDVMPRVWAQLAGARLRLVGRGLDARLGAADERIEAEGFVEDLGSAYAGAAAVAVPLTESGGTPLKFVEALAYGVPVVATPLAAQGLDVRPGEHFRSAADAGAFAAELVAVLRDGDAAMAARARRLAEREYSVETLTRLLAA
jgi:glycosyltransferase involved in cell wall biosynthesis